MATSRQNLSLLRHLVGLPDKAMREEVKRWADSLIVPVPAAWARWCDGRLTLTDGVPVPVADVTSAGVLYFTPYRGNLISLFDGSTWNLFQFTQRSLTLTLTAGSVYDVFIYDNNGTPTLETLVWANATTRATALVYLDGVPCKSGALTRRYLGTIYASGTNMTADAEGGSGVSAKRYVWNYNNRVERAMFGAESAASWTYSTAAYRASNNGSAARLNYVIGVSEDPIKYGLASLIHSDTRTQALAGAGLDVTNTTNQRALAYLRVQVAGDLVHGHAFGTIYQPAIGFHYLQLIEYGAGTGIQTWYGIGTHWYTYIQGTIMA